MDLRLNMMGLRLMEKQVKRLFILLYKDITQRYLDKLANSTNFAVHDSTIAQLLSLILLLLSLCSCFLFSTFSVCLSVYYSHALSHSLCYSLVPADVVLHIPKYGVTFQSCRSITILSYSLDELASVILRASTVFFAVVLYLDAICPVTHVAHRLRRLQAFNICRH